MSGRGRPRGRARDTVIWRSSRSSCRARRTRGARRSPQPGPARVSRTVPARSVWRRRRSTVCSPRTRRRMSPGGRDAETMAEMRGRYAAAAAEVPDLAHHVEGVDAILTAAAGSSWPLPGSTATIISVRCSRSPTADGCCSTSKGSRALSQNGIGPISRCATWPGCCVRSTTPAGRSSRRQGVSAHLGRGGAGRLPRRLCRRGGHRPRTAGLLLTAYLCGQGSVRSGLHEARNRPTWAVIPLAAITDRLLSDSTPPRRTPVSSTPKRTPGRSLVAGQWPPPATA